MMLDSLSLLKDKNIESAKITCGDLLWLVHPVPGVTLFDLKTQRLSFIEGKDEQGRPLNTESDFLLLRIGMIFYGYTLRAEDFLILILKIGG